MLHPTQPAAPKRQLTLLDSTCIIVGIIIGSGIYKSTPLIASNVASTSQLVGLWLFGGLMALVGALCYAELATTYPQSGGDYVFLTKSFGRRTGFLFSWAEFWIIRPGNVGMMAYVFAEYAMQIWPLRWAGTVVYACGAVSLLTLSNALGVRSGKWTQNVLTILKVVGLLAICGAGFWLPAAVESQPGAPPPTDFRFAAILVLFTYGGWNEMSYVAAEVRDPSRNIFRALVLGTLAVTAVYVLTNLAFVRLLGFHGVQTAGAVAADAFRDRLPMLGARAIGVLVCLSCLGAINGMLFTGPRIYYALGTEHRLFAWLGRWNGRWDSPLRALVIQSLATLALVIGFGGSTDGFERLLIYTTPVFWFFAFLVGIGLFILRYKEPDVPRPHRVVFFPWTVVVFCLGSAFLFNSALTYAIQRSAENDPSLLNTLAICVIILAVGVVTSCFDSPLTKGQSGK